MFADQYKGGAELTTEAIIDAGLFPCNKVLSQNLTIPTLEEYKDSFWIFGNFASVPEQCLLYAAKNLNYSVLEYDYKYCHFRSPGKHILASGECDCHKSRKGKIVSVFLHNAKKTWWMSHNQMRRYQEIFPFLSNSNNKVLSSVFSEETLNFIQSLDTTKKEDKWLILKSPSWIKGVEEAIEHAEKNNLNYELIWGIDHKDLLRKLAKSKGIIFFPRAGDTCPRMTIEAKLLDCELILNDNVQHKDEKWFSNKKSTLNYLKQRTNIFWREIESIAAKHLNIPQSDNIISDLKFKIVVPFFNCEKWIKKCINSVKNQKYKNFECLLINDVSTDNSADIVKKEIADDPRFNLIQNKEKKYALANIVNAIGEFNCDDNDVIVLLDGDDWLASSSTLNKLCNVYGDKLMTYGSYVFNPSGVRGPEPSEYSDEVIKTNSFRKDQWRASHLRTFKYELWKHIDHNDLKDENGNYYKMTYDQAIMLPLLEMAGDRSVYVPEILHVYNKDNPLNIDKNKAQEQHALAQKIRSKKPYSKLA
jgi:hypothetical protein